jgi:transposase
VLALPRVAPALAQGRLLCASCGPTSQLDEGVLRSLVEEQNDATLAEYAERLEERTGRRYSVSMLSRVFKRITLSRKGRRYDTAAASAAVPVPVSSSRPRSPLSA